MDLKNNLSFLLKQPVKSGGINALEFNENVLSSRGKYSLEWPFKRTVANLRTVDAALFTAQAAAENNIVGKMGFTSEHVFYRLVYTL